MAEPRGTDRPGGTGRPGGRDGPDRLVVGAIIVDDLARPTRTLAARRSRPPALAGRWELPGGKVEPGETPEQALRRELDEELGVDVVLSVELVSPAGPGSTWPLTPGLVMRTWWCAVAAGHPAAGEAHDELRWVDAGDIADLDWLTPDLPIVDRIAAELRRSAG